MADLTHGRAIKSVVVGDVEGTIMAVEDLNSFIVVVEFLAGSGCVAFTVRANTDTLSAVEPARCAVIPLFVDRFAVEVSGGPAIVVNVFVTEEVARCPTAVVTIDSLAATIIEAVDETAEVADSDVDGVVACRVVEALVSGVSVAELVDAVVVLVDSDMDGIIVCPAVDALVGRFSVVETVDAVVVLVDSDMDGFVACSFVEAL
ncbi:unnamed protein product, partial [Toxocara canis]|uniref:Uncharacterized protein n=1 Tax=Toxocara canis TaxID=6265 RepID=A0A183U1P9_TOXCA